MKSTGLPSRFDTRAAGSVELRDFIETIHDGIEFALGQLETEISKLLQRTLALRDDELGELFSAWEIRGCDVTLSIAARKMFQMARTLGVETPTIDAALGLRKLSAFEQENDFVTTLFRQPRGKFNEDCASVINEFYGALRAASLITFAEGLAVLTAGSERHGLGLGLAEVLCSWRKCRGLRLAILDDIAATIQATPNLPNLLDDDDLSDIVMSQQELLRHAVWRAVQLRIPAPALMASLDYLDSFRGAWLPVNLIHVPPMPSGLGGDPLRPLTAIDEEQNRHAHCQAVGDLVDDQRTHRVGSLAVNLDPAINRPRMHDQGLGFGQGEAGLR